MNFPRMAIVLHSHYEKLIGKPVCVTGIDKETGWYKISPGAEAEKIPRGALERSDWIAPPESLEFYDPVTGKRSKMYKP